MEPTTTDTIPRVSVVDNVTDLLRRALLERPGLAVRQTFASVEGSNAA